MTVALSAEARDFNWLLNNFVDGTAGVTDTVAVSSDGLLMAMSCTLDRAGAEKLAAIISGFVSLGQSSATTFGFGTLDQVIVSMNHGYLFVTSISGGSCLGVVANRTCDVGLVGYHTRRLVERVGTVLSPALIAELRSALLG